MSLINCEEQSHKTVSTNLSFCVRERRAETESEPTDSLVPNMLLASEDIKQKQNERLIQSFSVLLRTGVTGVVGAKADSEYDCLGGGPAVRIKKKKNSACIARGKKYELMTWSCTVPHSQGQRIADTNQHRAIRTLTY